MRASTVSPCLSVSSVPLVRQGALRLTVLTALLATVALVGCGRDEGKKAATQVAAKVNNEEISVHQVNYVLSRLGQIPQARAEEAKKQALERLVEQELLVQQAKESKLDRNPNVQQAIESARREVLARAYVEQSASSAGKPGVEEVASYYRSHPELFTERKIYRIHEISIADQPEVLAQAKAEALKIGAQGASLEPLVAWLKSRNIPFRPEAAVKPAEQLPLEHLPALHKLKAGQVLAIEAPGSLLVVQVVASQPQPMDEKTARPIIEQFLIGESRKQVATAELKRLRDTAKIEYVGEFARAPSGAAPAAATTGGKLIPAAAGQGGGDAEAINKGLKGLK